MALYITVGFSPLLGLRVGLMSYGASKFLGVPSQSALLVSLVSGLFVTFLSESLTPRYFNNRPFFSNRRLLVLPRFPIDAGFDPSLLAASWRWHVRLGVRPREKRPSDDKTPHPGEYSTLNRR